MRIIILTAWPPARRRAASRPAGRSAPLSVTPSAPPWYNSNKNFNRRLHSGHVLTDTLRGVYHRRAVRRALVELDYLAITWRSIPQPIRLAQLAARITCRLNSFAISRLASSQVSTGFRSKVRVLLASANTCDGG